jgi:MFS family permease
LRQPDFRRFFIGYSTSNLGSGMAATATTFAILDSGQSAGDLGLVMAAGIVPILLCLIGGGVVADRLGSRRVMLATDAIRTLVQAVFAIALFTGSPPLWVYLALTAVRGAGDGFFGPSLSALIPEVINAEELTDANALMGIVDSAASVAGPATSGVIVALFGPAAVLALDAASYGVSVLALWSVRVANPAPRTGRSVLADLREGWHEFRSRTWLWLVTVQFALFNLIVWAPFLVLGPTLAHQHYGGAAAWGATMGSLGAGSVVGGLALLGREPKRPMFTATVATIGYAFPSLALGLRAPLPWVTVAAFSGGIGTAVFNTLYSATEQRLLPPGVRARVSSYGTMGAYVFGPLGLAAAGPIAAATGIPAVLLTGVCWQIAATAFLLTLPVIRTLATAPAPLNEKPDKVSIH